MSLLFEQLSQFCECGDITQEDVNDMISVISLATGWMRNPCETFEKSGRREVIDLPSCPDCAYTFEPYYHPFDKDSFSFKLIKVKGVEEEVTDVVDVAYSEYENLFRMKLDCGCDTKCNDCETEYKLVVTYDAGYEQIPDCLLPVFCNLMEVIHAKNSCDCCESCSCEDEARYDQYGNLITQQIKYKSGDVVSVFLETDLGKMLVAQYKQQLSLMSLLSTSHNLWGFVV